MFPERGCRRGGPPIIRWTLKLAWRAIVAVIGTTVLLLGIAMLVLPGPGVLVIAAALAILATEFAWASHLLRRVRREIRLRTGYGREVEAEPQAAAAPQRARE